MERIALIILVVLAAGRAGVGDFSNAEARAIREWNGSNLRLCADIWDQGMHEWPDFKASSRALPGSWAGLSSADQPRETLHHSETVSFRACSASMSW